MVRKKPKAALKQKSTPIKLEPGTRKKTPASPPPKNTKSAAKIKKEPIVDLAARASKSQAPDTRSTRSQGKLPLLYQHLLSRRHTHRPVLLASLKRKPADEPDDANDSSKDADGDIDPEYLVDTEPRASTAGRAPPPPVLPKKSLRERKRARIQAPERPSSPIPRGAAVGEHALRGPAHPDALSVHDAPLVPNLSEVYFLSFQILYLLTFFLTRSNSVALRATTCPPRKALLLANLSNGAKGVRTASTAVRRAVLMHSIPTLSWILLSASALFLPRIPKVRSFFLLVIFISYLFL